MDNRYSHFADDTMRNAERLANEARDNAELARLNWQEKMENLLVVNVQDLIAILKGEQLSPLERAWKTNAALKMLVHDFASGILYAQEKLG